MKKDLPPTADPFQHALSSQGYTGTVALLVTDFGGQVVYALNAEQHFPAASTIKVPLLILALQLAQTGELALTEQVTLQAADQVSGAGVLHELQPGLQLCWQDILTLMIVVSDNTATNLLIERLGIARVNAWLATQGLNGTRLIGKLQLPVAQQNEAQRRGERNRTTAQNQVWLLRELATGQLLDASHTTLALNILERQQLRDLIGPGIPTDAQGQPMYRLASKSGELLGVHHDVGLLYTPRPLVVALLSQGGTDPRSRPQNQDAQVLARALWPLLARLGQTRSQASSKASSKTTQKDL